MAIVLTTFPGRDAADCDASLGRNQFENEEIQEFGKDKQ